MSSYGPFIVIFLAIVAAASIAFIAWELTSKDVQKSIDRNVTDDEDDDEDDHERRPSGG